MDQSNVINLGILLVAAVAAGIAAWQALDARNARSDALLARDDAKSHELAALAAATQSATAATRSADELAEANAIRRSQLPSEPWELKRSGSKVELINVTKSILFVVDVNDMAGGSDLTPFQELPLDQVGPRQSLFFDYSKTLDSEPTMTFDVSWVNPDTGEVSHWRRTLS